MTFVKVGGGGQRPPVFQSFLKKKKNYQIYTITSELKNVLQVAKKSAYNGNFFVEKLQKSRVKSPIFVASRQSKKKRGGSRGLTYVKVFFFF